MRRVPQDRVSQLPPPPPIRHPGEPAPSAWPVSPSGRPPMPTWRTAKAGWIALHIVIGLGIGFGVFIAAVLAISFGHFDIEAVNRVELATRITSTITPDQQRIVGGFGGAFLLALAAGVLGWLLFVYLRARTAMRVALLIAIPLVAALIGYGLMAAVLPKLPGY
jgi:hypothetical protein